MSNFQLLEVVFRYRDPQLQVGENLIESTFNRIRVNLCGCFFYKFCSTPNIKILMKKKLLPLLVLSAEHRLYLNCMI